MVISAGWIGIAVTILIDPTGMPSGFDIELLGILIVALLIAAGFISIAFSYITVGEDELVIRNFWPRARHVPLRVNPISGNRLPGCRGASSGSTVDHIRVGGPAVKLAIRDGQARSFRTSPPAHQGPRTPHLRSADRPAVAPSTIPRA